MTVNPVRAFIAYSAAGRIGFLKFVRASAISDNVYDAAFDHALIRSIIRLESLAKINNFGFKALS